jgi:hypothetical protein
LKNSFRTFAFVTALPLVLGSAGCLGEVDTGETTDTSASASVSMNFSKVEFKSVPSFVPAPGELIVDGTSNTIALVTTTAPGHQTLGLKQPGKPWAAYEVTSDGEANPTGLGFSLRGTNVTLHGLSDDGLFAATYGLGNAGGKKGPIQPAFTPPTYEVEEIKNAMLAAAGEVVLPSTGATRFIDILISGFGEAPPRDSGGDLGFLVIEMEDVIVPHYTPPIGSNKGSLTIDADGHGWATFPSDDGLGLYSLGNLDSSAPSEPELVTTLQPGADLRPGSARLGIIAILIGLVRKPAPTLSYQVGNELVQLVWDGTKFRNLARQAIPSGASGLMMDDGIYWYADSTGVYRGKAGVVTLVQ